MSAVERSKGSRSGYSDSAKPRGLDGARPVEAATPDLRHTAPVEQGGITIEEIKRCMTHDSNLQVSNLQDELVPFLCQALEDTGSSQKEAAAPLRRSQTLRDVMTPTAFVKRVLKHGQCSACILVVAMLYLDRLKAKAERGLLVASASLQTRLLVAMVVANKLFEDGGADNAKWAKIGGLALRRLNELELDMLLALDFHLGVQPEEYKSFLANLLVERLVPASRRGSAEELLKRRSVPSSPCSDSGNSSRASSSASLPEPARMAGSSAERRAESSTPGKRDSSTGRGRRASHDQRGTSQRGTSLSAPLGSEGVRQDAPFQRRGSMTEPARTSIMQWASSAKKWSSSSERPARTAVFRSASEGRQSSASPAPNRAPSSERISRRASLESEEGKALGRSKSRGMSFVEMLSGSNTPAHRSADRSTTGSSSKEGSSGSSKSIGKALKMLMKPLGRDSAVKLTDGKQTTKYSDLASRMGTLDKLLTTW